MLLFPLVAVVTSRAVRTAIESENHDRETHITSASVGETRIPSDICVGKQGSLGICVRGNEIHRETYITVTPADLAAQKSAAM